MGSIASAPRQPVITTLRPPASRTSPENEGCRLPITMPRPSARATPGPRIEIVPPAPSRNGERLPGKRNSVDGSIVSFLHVRPSRPTGIVEKSSRTPPTERSLIHGKVSMVSVRTISAGGNQQARQAGGCLSCVGRDRAQSRSRAAACPCRRSCPCPSAQNHAASESHLQTRPVAARPTQARPRTRRALPSRPIVRLRSGGSSCRFPHASSQHKAQSQDHFATSPAVSPALMAGNSRLSTRLKRTSPLPST